VIRKLTDEAKLELAALAADDNLTAEAVLKVAENPDNPLHDYLEWDDGVAAAEFRKGQCRALIASVRVELSTPETVTVNVRAYVKVAPLGRSVPVAEALADWRDELVTAARRDVRSWRRKYAHLGAAELQRLIEET
jgi:hypothetical protein